MFKHKSFRKSARKWNRRGPRWNPMESTYARAARGEKCHILERGRGLTRRQHPLYMRMAPDTESKTPRSVTIFLFCTAADLAQGVVGQKISYLLKRQCNKCKRPGYQGATKTKTKNTANTQQKNFFCFFFAGGCLGRSRAERPSVSWTKVLETLCLQAPQDV